MKKYLQLLNGRRTEYKKYRPVYCACLREYVFFNANGFNHLRYHIDGRPRKPAAQMYKLGLLPLVIPAIRAAPCADQYVRRLAPVGRKKKDGEKILKEVQYWSLIAVVGQKGVKIKVVLRKIGTGQLHFWSVMKLAENQKAPT
jgi:hypothetical protein